MDTAVIPRRRETWNKAKLVGQKAASKAKDIWAIRARLQMQDRARDRAVRFGAAPATVGHEQT